MLFTRLPAAPASAGPCGGTPAARHRPACHKDETPGSVAGGETAAATKTSDAAPVAAKTVTLEGTMTCAKCNLKETAKCVNALVVKDGAKSVTYYLEDKGTGEEYHESLCGGGSAPATVTGAVVQKDGHAWIKASNVALKK